MSSVAQRKAELLENWNPYVNIVGQYLQDKRQQDLSEYDKINMATVLENALGDLCAKRRSKLMETTDSSDISFLGVQLPVIAALLPSLVANKIALVQAMDRRIAAIFYMNILYGQAKGAVESGDSLSDAKLGHNRTLAGRMYGSTRVTHEAFTDNASTQLQYYPVNAGTAMVLIGTEAQIAAGTPRVTGYINAAGDGIYTTPAFTVADGTNFGSCALDHATGVYTIDAVIQSDETAVISYKYDYQTMDVSGRSAVPEVNIEVTSEAITAEDFPLRANYTLAAALDLEKAHGLVLEDEVVKILGQEIKFEIDHLVIDYIMNAAVSGAYDDAGTLQTPATAIGEWDASLGTTQEWVFKKYEFIDFLERGSNNIFSKTLKGVGNFIIGGNSVCRVLKQFGDHFKPVAGLDKTPPTGPMEIGSFGGRTVIQDPFVTDTRYAMGFRSDNYLFAGMLYCPYIPLFATPTVTLADLKSQKAFYSSSGFKVVNPGFYTYGTMTNLVGGG